MTPTNAARTARNLCSSITTDAHRSSVAAETLREPRSKTGQTSRNKSAQTKLSQLLSTQKAPEHAARTSPGA